MEDTNFTPTSVCPWSQVSPGRITIQKCTIPGCPENHFRDYRPHGARAPNIDATHYSDNLVFDLQAASDATPEPNEM